MKSFDQSCTIIDAAVAAPLTLRLGATLICSTCGICGVLRTLPSPPTEVPTCHGPMRVGRPVRCSDVRRRQAADMMIAGALYCDALSGIEFSCTRGGGEQVRMGERPLLPRTLVAA